MSNSTLPINSAADELMFKCSDILFWKKKLLPESLTCNISLQ